MPEDFEVKEVNPTTAPTPDKLPMEEPAAPPKAALSPATPMPSPKDPEADKTKPYIPRRFAAISMVPRRQITITAPAPYENVEISLWINPPDGEVQARAESTRNIADYMSHFILDWSLTDENGKKLPIEEESMMAFPKDLWDWMIQQFGEARMRPLVPPNDDTTTKNQTPRPINRNSNPSLNGSTG